MGRRSSVMRRHRRTPGPSVFCAGRVTPDRVARTVVFHRRSLVSILWLAASMMCREGVGETENPDGAALNLTTVRARPFSDGSAMRSVIPAAKTLPGGNLGKG